MERETREVSVLIVESRLFSFVGLRSMIHDARGVTVVGRASSLDELRDHLRARHVDVIVVGHLYGCGDTAQQVDAIASDAAAEIRLVLLIDPSETPRREAPRCGSAVLPTDIGAEELRAAIRMLSAGYLIRFPGEDRAPRGAVEQVPAPAPAEVGGMTRRESDVFSLLARGHSNADISAFLSISENTVKSHVRSILAKLGLQNRASVAAYAHEHRIL